MRVGVIAHRGASGSCPENTLPAFRKAALLGADMIELDVQCSRDGEVVVIHDWTLDRTTDGTGSVVHRTWSEIAALDAGSWFAPAFAGTRVPRLAEVFAEVALPVNVELKSGDNTEVPARTLAAVQAAGAMDRVIFSSFEPESLQRLRERSADAVLAVLWDGGDVASAIRQAQGVGASSLHLRTSRGAAMGIAAGHAAGLQVRVWTVNTPGEFAPLAAAGVDAIFTDHPERFLHPRPT